jgi:hypothetical protein
MEVVGDECIDMISGELLRDEIHRFAFFQAALDVGLLQDDKELEVLLPSHSRGSEEVGINGDGLSSGKILRGVQELERMRETKGMGDGREELGFSGGAPGDFIGRDEVIIVISLPATVGMRWRH